MRKAKIVLFPQHRRVGHIRHVVATALAMPEAWRRKVYWGHRVKDLRRQLDALELRPIEVERAVAELTAAVRQEVEWRAAKRQRKAQAPDGEAST